MSAVGDLLATLNWQEDSDPDGMVSDAITLLRVVDPDTGERSLYVLQTTGTDAVLLTGMLVSAQQIVGQGWAQVDDED